MFYRLINTNTNQPMGLSYNSTTIEEVREDIVTFLSVDEDIVGLTEAELAAKVATVCIRVEESEVMFEPYQKATIENYLVLPEPKHELAVQSRLRVKHISAYSIR